MPGCCTSLEPLTEDDRDVVEHFQDLDIDPEEEERDEDGRARQLLPGLLLAVSTAFAYVIAV